MPDDEKDAPQSKNAPKTTKKTVDDTLSAVGNLLIKGGETYDKFMGTPQLGSPVKTEARVGQAPQQLAVPFNPSQVPGALPTPNVPPQAGGPPRTGPGVIPSEFGSKSAKQGAVVGSAIDNISQAIHTFKAKKDADALSKAQNSWQLFQTALQQGDQHTANLLATDPKIIKSWEKYLKMEFPRETGTPSPQQKPQGTVPPDRSFIDRVMGKNKAPLPRMPEMNTPGGIAVPRPGPEQQLHSAQVATVLEGLRTGDPRAIASVYGENYKLTPDEFSHASKVQYGLELSPAQIATMDEHSKLALVKMKSDFLKYVTGQSLTSQRAQDVANIQGAWKLAGEEVRASAIRDVGKSRVEAIKSIKASAPDKMNQIIMKSNMDMYSKMASTLTTTGTALIKSGNEEKGQALLNEAKGYAAKSDEIRTRMEAFDDLKKLGIDLEGLDDEPEENEEP